MPANKYAHIPFSERTGCLVCGAPEPTPLFDLPAFPLTEVFVKEQLPAGSGVADQLVQYCSVCGHAQLKNMLDAGFQYVESDYSYRTSQSSSGMHTVDMFVEQFLRDTGRERFGTVVEIGCNDFYLLKCLKPKADRCIGVDPVLKGREEEFSSEGMTAIGKFFEEAEISGPIDVVLCKDTLEHVPQPREFLAKVIEKGSDDTLFYFEVPVLDTLVEDCRFDQIYHQHVNLFSLHSLAKLLGELGCGILTCCINYNHWGSAIFSFRKNQLRSTFKVPPKPDRHDMVERYRTFRAEMESLRKRLEYVPDPIYGYGAAAMLPILAYHMQSDLSFLRCVLDDDAAKDGLFYVSPPIQIRRPQGEDLRKAFVIMTAAFSRMSTKTLLRRLFEMEPKRIVCPFRTL